MCIRDSYHIVQQIKPKMVYNYFIKCDADKHSISASTKPQDNEDGEELTSLSDVFGVFFFVWYKTTWNERDISLH